MAAASGVPDAGSGAEVVATHISMLVLTGDRVLKFRKPVVTDFCDFSTVEARDEDCRREVELNRRLCDDVYLGVGHVRLDEGDDAAPPEPCVVMRRLPADRQLSALVARGEDLAGPLQQVAARLAAFHRAAARSPEIAADGEVGAVRRLWQVAVDELRPQLGATDDQRLLDEVEQLAASVVPRAHRALRRAGRGRRGVRRPRRSAGRQRVLPRRRPTHPRLHRVRRPPAPPRRGHRCRLPGDGPAPARPPRRRGHVRPGLRGAGRHGAPRPPARARRRLLGARAGEGRPPPRGPGRPPGAGRGPRPPPARPPPAARRPTAPGPGRRPARVGQVDARGHRGPRQRLGGGLVRPRPQGAGRAQRHHPHRRRLRRGPLRRRAHRRHLRGPPRPCRHGAREGGDGGPRRLLGGRGPAGRPPPRSPRRPRASCTRCAARSRPTPPGPGWRHGPPGATTRPTPGWRSPGRWPSGPTRGPRPPPSTPRGRPTPRLPTSPTCSADRSPLPGPFPPPPPRSRVRFAGSWPPRNAPRTVGWVGWERS